MPICRNCLLCYHINLDVNKKKDKAILQEKTKLLDYYERKTITERMTVSLQNELKIDTNAKDCHEIMDIKALYSQIYELGNIVLSKQK